MKFQLFCVLFCVNLPLAAQSLPVSEQAQALMKNKLFVQEQKDMGDYLLSLDEKYAKHEVELACRDFQTWLLNNGKYTQKVMRPLSPQRKKDYAEQHYNACVSSKLQKLNFEILAQFSQQILAQQKQNIAAPNMVFQFENLPHIHRVENQNGVVVIEFNEKISPLARKTLALNLWRPLNELFPFSLHRLQTDFSEQEIEQYFTQMLLGTTDNSFRG